MPNLRQIVDGKTLEAQGAPVAKRAAPSPAADHVARHVQDPFGQTKDDLDELNQKRMDYEMAKQHMHMKLAPVESVTKGIRNMHQMMENPEDADQGYMTPQDQLNQNYGMPPAQTATPGQSPMGPMNNMRPSQTGFAPGKAPGFPGQQVVPGKMGMPQPGQAQPGAVAGKPGMPAGWGAPGFNPQAQKPAGNGALPGAKGPGDPKVQNKIGKAQSNSKNAGNSGRKIKIQVHADRSVSPANSTLETAMRSASIRTCSDKKMEARGKKMESGCHSCDDEEGEMDAYGTSEGVSKAWDTRGRGVKSVPMRDQPRSSGVGGTWHEGTAGDNHRFQAKVYTGGSEYGINQGNVSKLQIKDGGGKEVYNYDRGLDHDHAPAGMVDAITKHLSTKKG